MTIDENVKYLQYFGFNLTFWKTLSKLSLSVSKNKISWYINKRNYSAIRKYILSCCDETMHNLHNNSLKRCQCISNEKKNSVIWTMWWQGEDNAPELIRNCIDSMRKNGNGHKVIVIDKNNYKDYVKLPEIILKRYNEVISCDDKLNKYGLGNTHLSDIIRFYLLSAYGGVWMDASIFLSDTLDNVYFEKDWTTLNEDDKWYEGEGQWTVFFMGAKNNNILTVFLYNMLIEYWSKNKYYVNYLMIYNMMQIAMDNNREIKEMMKNEHCGNEHVNFINFNYNNLASFFDIDEFLKYQHIHKLSWKWWGNTKNCKMNIKTENGELTCFGYLYKKYIGEI